MASEPTLWREANISEMAEAVDYDLGEAVEMWVVPVEPDLSALEKRISQRLFQRSPANLNATDRALLRAAVYEDVAEAFEGRTRT